MTRARVRVVVADDHPAYRAAVVHALRASSSVTVVGEAQDGLSALQLITAHRPQVALIDLRMPGMDGAQVASAARSAGLPTRVLVLSADDESAIADRAVRAGAAGFLSKEASRTDIVNAVLACANPDVVA